MFSVYDKVITMIRFKNGDVIKLDGGIKVGDKIIKVVDDNEIYVLMNNKVFMSCREEASDMVIIWLDEMNDIDELCLMSGCINIIDKVYDISEDKGFMLSVKELDLA